MRFLKASFIHSTSSQFREEGVYKWVTNWNIKEWINIKKFSEGTIKFLVELVYIVIWYI